MSGSTETPMTVASQIREYMLAQPERKRRDMEVIHDLVLGLMPDCRLWFLDGRDSRGRTVSNPNIGYGFQTMAYRDGRTREFYQIGLSANSTGLSVYIMGLADKTYLGRTYKHELGKARITGYCIRFSKLDDIDVDVLVAAMRDGVQHTPASDRDVGREA